MMNKDALLREIRAAFAWRSYPGDDRLALRRPECPGYEGEDVQRFFQGKDWREISLKSIMTEPGLDTNAFIFFLTREGFVYYLPAFLEIALSDDDPIDLGETVALKLTPSPKFRGEAWEKNFSETVALLTEGEKRAVIHALEYLADEFDRLRFTTNQARIALEDYWGHLTEDLPETE